MLARYLKTLVTIQVLLARRGTFISDEQAAWATGRVVSIVVLLHCLTFVATLYVVSIALDIPMLRKPAVLALAMSPLPVLLFFLRSNTANFQDIELQVSASSPEEVERNWQDAKSFMLRSVILAVAAALVLALSSLRTST